MARPFKKKGKSSYLSVLFLQMGPLTAKSSLGARGNSQDVGTAGSSCPTGAWWGCVAARCPSTTGLVCWLLVLLFEVHLGMPLAFITAGKLASAKFTREGLFSSVSTNVCCQVVTAAKGTHADAALEGLVARMNAQVACELIRTRETPVTVLSWTGMWSLVDRCLARPVWVFARPDGFEGEGLWGLMMVVLGCMLLLATQEPWVNLLLVLERSDGLQGRDRWRIHSDGVHGLERFMLHHPNFTLVVEQVVVGDHGEEAAVHGRFGGGTVIV